MACSPHRRANRRDGAGNEDGLNRRARRIARLLCRPTQWQFALQFVQPSLLHLELFYDETHHPYSFVIRMPHFFHDARKHFLLSCYFLLQKLSPPLQLQLENSRPCLPGKRNPCQERRTLAPIRPLFTL